MIALWSVVLLCVLCGGGCLSGECSGDDLPCPVSVVSLDVDVPDATVTPVSSGSTMFMLSCSSGGGLTACSSSTSRRVEPGTYVYDVTAAGSTQRVSLVVEATRDACCHYTAGYVHVTFRGDAGP